MRFGEATMLTHLCLVIRKSETLVHFATSSVLTSTWCRFCSSFVRLCIKSLIGEEAHNYHFARLPKLS